MEFQASQEVDDTKAAIDATNSRKIDWKSGDHISVFDGAGNRDFSLTAGDGTTHATFSGSASAAATYTALYPYQSGASLSGDKIIAVTLPASQTATLGSFDPKAALMMGVSADGTNEYAFKNCVGYIKVTITAPAKSISLTSYYDEPFAGTITLDYNGGIPTATVTANASPTVTLVPEAGDTFAAGTYYLAVLPQAMQFGFILSYTDSEGIVHNRVYNGAFSTKRSVVTNMGTLSTSNTYTNRQIVYFAPEKFESFNAVGVLKLDDGTRNNVKVSAGTHVFADGVGVITFEHDILEINHLFYTEPDVNNITKVILPQSLTGFYLSPFGFSSITELYAPRSVTHFDVALMPNLRKLVLPKSMTVPEGMITANPLLEEIYAKGATNEHDAIISDGVLLAYAPGKHPVSYAIPDGVTRIGTECFFHSTIQSVAIPNSVTVIGAQAFYSCKSLTSVTIPSSVKTLERSCFANTSNLTSVNFESPSQVTSIPDYAFSWSGNRSIYASATTIGERAYQAYNAYYQTKTDIVIPDTVTSIGNSVFSQAKNIESVVLGSSVQSVGSYAFYLLKSTTTSGASLAIPVSEQTSLKYIYSKNPFPPVLDTNAFPDDIITSEFQKVYVPTGSVELYKNAPVWSKFADKIEGYYASDVTNLSASATANCYIVSSEGKYMFKTVKGNSANSAGDIKSVEVVWESYGTSTKPTVGALINNVKYQSGYITFTATSAKGNALIAAKDASGNILWSWHIWLTDAPADVDYGTPGKMMDRNLGATSKTAGSVETYGLLYQWGRKDPFLNNAEYAGAALSTAYSTSTIGTIEYSVQNPTTYINQESMSGDWHYVGDENLWKTTKTQYDPCPVGYRVADGGFWPSSTSDEWNSTDWDTTNKGRTINGSWYPASGNRRRDNGSYVNAESNGFYWTVETTTSGSSRQAYALNLATPDGRNPNNRAWGFAVRCQKVQ